MTRRLSLGWTNADHEVRARLRPGRARRHGAGDRSRRVDRAGGGRRRHRGARHPRASRPLPARPRCGPPTPRSSRSRRWPRGSASDAPDLVERVTVVAPGEEFDAGLPVRAVGELHAVIHPELPRFHNSGYVVTARRRRPSSTPATRSPGRASRSTCCARRCRRRGSRRPRRSTSPARSGRPATSRSTTGSTPRPGSASSTATSACCSPEAQSYVRLAEGQDL